MKRLILITTVAMFSLNAHAANSSADDVYGTTSPSPSPAPNPGSTPFPTYVTPPAPTPKPLPSPAPMNNASINPAANTGKASQDSGAGANAAAGAALIAAGMALMANPPTQPAGAALIAMGMLALAQSGHDSGAADQSAATAAASYQGNTKAASSTATADVTNPAFGTGTAGFNNPKAQQGLAALKAAGYDYNSSGLVNPDGSTTPNSAFNSAGGMSAAGMDANTVKTVQDALAKVNGNVGGAKVSTMALSEGGGGSGADSKAAQDFSFKLKDSKFGLSDAAKKSMVAGKTVNFDGEPIGVRGQNIFDMIHVAYQKKKDSNDFLDEGGKGPAAAAVSLRAPASVATPVSMPITRPIQPSRPAFNNR